ncbi:MAG TPA: hypothetical protein VNE60_11740, partial [Gemmatimonadaceae bacterium]|nr:hypothetical protein [Gemmatimonadaceae bacterium]
MPLTGARDATEPGGRMRPETRAVIAIIVVGIVARVILAATIGLGVDESYEVVVSRALSWGYLDHPPLSFWMASVVA